MIQTLLWLGAMIGVLAGPMLVSIALSDRADGYLWRFPFVLGAALWIGGFECAYYGIRWGLL